MVTTGELKKFFRGEVLTDPGTLERYSHDYSIFEVRPRTVVYPKNSEDLQKLVKFVSAKKKSGNDVSITARSAGTDMTGGPLGESIIVDFTRHMNRILEVAEDHAVVEPGAYFRNFEKEIAPKGLLYPPYPASKDICALGGMIANDSGGEKTLAYGKTHDFVRELTVILSDGEEYTLKPLDEKELREKSKEKSFAGTIYRKTHRLLERNYDLIQSARPRVSKNSCGYQLWNVWDKKTFNLAQLMVGSQGTLGLITQAKLGLVKRKEHSSLVVMFLNDLKPLPELIAETLAMRPESLESFDDKTLGIAMKFLPGLIKSMGGNFVKLVFQFIPEMLMSLRGGFPKMVMLAEFASDDPAELEEKTEALRERLLKFGVRVRIVRSAVEAQKYVTIRRQSFALLHDHSTGKDAAPFIDDIIVKPEYLPEFLPKLNQILDPHKDLLVYTIAGHPGNGNFHIIPLMDLKDPRIRSLIPEISEEVYDLVLGYRGSITAEHNDGLIRTPYVEKMYGKEMAKIFGEIKKIFDPLNIFNPGKKVGGDLAYSMDHIKK